ncbi:MAG TPA: prepilin-type N-terminal cleavage/methylation domain-containing protein [Terriglobales bacterium]|nr:prepilin-type N-terminal cleavage/methylation domain-containing protein [Terriglobales bacterium]
MQKRRGFSLIELLIVIAIILIIASMAIPSLTGAHRTANEAAAVKALQTINTAQVSYNSTYPTIGFAANLAMLGGTSCLPPSSRSACLIDNQIASGTKHGYNFVITGLAGTPAATYQVLASPTVPNHTGVRYFCSFADGVVRVSESAISACDTNLPPLQ